MNQQTETMKLALAEMKIGNYNSAAERLEASLAQPQQEPVACVSSESFTGQPVTVSDIITCSLPVGTPLYTSPPARKPLTDGQKLMCWSRATHDADVEHKTENQCLMDYGSEIEAAHGIKEQP